MSTESRKQLLVGLRGSGKSTYLAALWHQVESAEIPTSLRVPTLQADREYLNALRKKWLTFEPLERTAMGAEQTVTLTLEREDGSARADVLFPDLSGESYKQQWVERRTTQQYADHVATARGIILFVHPLLVVRPERVEPGSVSADTPWDPERTPTQVQLVEILQFIRYLDPLQRPLPVAVVVSAWDTVAKGVRPRDWLSRSLPLLDQFLTTNYDGASLRAYGVSALGGHLPDEIDTLKRVNPPSRRPYLVDEANRRYEDIGMPIRWLLDN